MNIISRCYRLLFERFSAGLFESPALENTTETWKETLHKCQCIEALNTLGYLGKAKVHSRAVCVPAGSLKLIFDMSKIP